MRGASKNLFKSPASNNKESVEPNVVGQNGDGSDKVDGYKVHLGNGYYLDGIWPTEEQAASVLSEFLEFMARRFVPAPPSHE